MNWIKKYKKIRILVNLINVLVVILTSCLITQECGSSLNRALSLVPNGSVKRNNKTEAIEQKKKKKIVDENPNEIVSDC